MNLLVELIEKTLQNRGDEGRIIKEAFDEYAERQGLTGFHYDKDDYVKLKQEVSSKQHIQQIQQLKMEKLQFENAASSDVSSKDDFPIIWIASVAGVGILGTFAYWIIKWKTKRK